MLTESDFDQLLDDLCAKLGFMLRAPEREHLSIPAFDDIDQFAEAILRVEGLQPPFDRQLRVQIASLTRAAYARAASRPANIDLFVLDTLANDIEGFGDVLRLLNHPEIGWSAHVGREIEVGDVLPSLLRLIRSGRVEACVPDETGILVGAGDTIVPSTPFEGTWFRMTAKGRVAHQTWTG